jgi:replicative DNA helicase
LERILRSVLQVGGNPESEEARNNWNRLIEHPIEYPIEEDKKIWVYLRTFYNTMSAPPDFSLVKEYFEKLDDIETVERLEEVKKAQFYIRTNFLSIVRSELEQQQVKNLILLCRDTSAIAEHGRNLEKPVNGKKVMRGVNDAVNYLFEKLPEFTRVDSGEKLEGVISDDADEFLDEYEIISKTNKYAGRNLFGLEPVDSACEGHRSGEFWVHCASPGELKTSLALNYAYNNAYVYGKNIFYAILEMPYKQLRRQLYVIHSSNGKFVTDWHDKDVKAGRGPYVGLDYRSVRDGKLDALSLERLKIIAQDFKANAKGKLYVWRPEHAVGIDDIRRKSEMFHNKHGCDGIVVDYLGLVKPKGRYSGTTDSTNEVVRDCRLMALNFGRGKTVPVLALFQLNRQGKLRADKSDGRYDFSAIAYANEIERSADVITYTYLNDNLRREGKFFLGCMKNRDNAIFERMVGKIIWQSKRMRAMDSGLIDYDNDMIVSAAKKISMRAEDMLL